ncbi:MAG TPA: hypothetical protein VFO86_08845, partial [Terriglobia bacterium]|nr:hypothetical protein [Terriglobia bacterium]
ISILRDTLGSSDPDVHRLRYLWVHTYAAPGLKQRVAAATPFAYSRFGNAGTSNVGIPSPVMDLSVADDRLWKNIWGIVLKGAVLDPKIYLIESAIQTYGDNRSNYIQMQFARAATAIDMDDAFSELPMLSDAERRQLQQRFAERNNRLAPLLNDSQLERFYMKGMTTMRQTCARNWELLRQRAEAEGLYFEPLLLPDGTATHAILWVAREELEANRQNAFDSRFLSISKPWGDKALLNWIGPTETRYFDSDDRRVNDGPNAVRQVEMIPLALYGLDHPKIPALLIDFRKPMNAKARELSHIAFDRFGKGVFTASPIANTAIHFGRIAARVATRRMGVDLFQPSRLLSYTQLKMVLSSNPGISSAMRLEIGRRVEGVAVNPLENDLPTEVALARSQYRALLDYASRPDGLSIDLERDRRAELTESTHGDFSKFLFRAGGVATFGLYRHREQERPDSEFILEAQRRNLNQTNFLHDVVKSGSYIDIHWDVDKVRQALRDVSAGDSLSQLAMADTAYRIFGQSRDENIRQLCLETLYQANTPASRKRLQQIAEDTSQSQVWRTRSASYLGDDAARPGGPGAVHPLEVGISLRATGND